MQKIPHATICRDDRIAWTSRSICLFATLRLSQSLGICKTLDEIKPHHFHALLLACIFLSIATPVSTYRGVWFHRRKILSCICKWYTAWNKTNDWSSLRNFDGRDSGIDIGPLHKLTPVHKVWGNVSSECASRVCSRTCLA